jgi:hypothetical protein
MIAPWRGDGQKAAFGVPADPEQAQQIVGEVPEAGNRREMHTGNAGPMLSPNTFATEERPISPQARLTPLPASG